MISKRWRCFEGCDDKNKKTKITDFNNSTKKNDDIAVAEWQNNRVDGGGGDYGGRNDGW